VFDNRVMKASMVHGDEASCVLHLGTERR